LPGPVGSEVAARDRAVEGQLELRRGNRNTPADGEGRAAPPERAAAGEARAGSAASPSALGAELAVLAGLLLLATFLRAELLGARSLCFNEGFGLFVARRGRQQIVEFLRFSDAHPPGYYLLLSAWRGLFGEDLATLRLPSAVAGVASVLATYGLARRWLGPLGAALAALLVAVNPFQVYASNELRMYMPLQLTILGATWAVERAVGTNRPGWWLAYGAAVALAGYFSYFAVLAVIPQVIWGCFHGGRRMLPGLLLAGAVAAALYAPWLRALRGFMHRNPQLQALRPPARWPDMTWYLAGFIGSHAFGGYLPGTQTYHRTASQVGPYVAPLVPFVAAGWAGVRALRDTATGMLAVFTWLGALAVTVLLSLATGFLVAYPRNVVFLQPFAAILAAGGVVHLLRSVRPAAGRAAAAGIGLLLVGTSWVALQNLQSVRPEFDAYRYDRAARFLEQRYQPGDLLIYAPIGVDYPFSYYFRRPVRAFSLGARLEDWEPAWLRRLAIWVVRSNPPHTGRVWVISSFPRPALARHVWEGVEASGYAGGEVADFLGVQVRLFVRGR